MKRIALIFCLGLFATTLVGQTKREPDTRIEEILSMLESDTIVKYIKHLESYRTRCYINSEELLSAQDWIYQTVKRYSDDYEVYLQHIEMPDTPFYGRYLDDELKENVSNIIVLKKGVVDPDKYVVIGGHFDSFNNDIIYGSFNNQAPGADDNASGTSAVMEMARVLANYESDYSIMFCAWNLEEIGLWGSAEFAKDAKQKGMDILGYINLDMIGYVKKEGVFKTDVDYNTKSKPLYQLYKEMASIYTPDLEVSRMVGMTGGSDHASFHKEGYQAIFPFEQSGGLNPIANIYYHSVDDVFGLGVNSMDFAMRLTKSSLATILDLATEKPNSILNIDNEELECMVYPNPIDTNGTLTYTIEKPDNVIINVYNMLGRLVSTMVNEYQTAGEYSVDINADQYPTGLYNVIVGTSNNSKTVRFIIK